MEEQSTQVFTAAWLRVEHWLMSHAPEDFAALRPPASERDVAAVTDGFPLHPHLAALLSAHDGSEESAGTNLLPRFTLLPAQQMAAYRPVGQRPEARWWVPFAATSTGEYLVVDHHDGARHGAVLMVDRELGVDGQEVWPSLLDLVTEVARVLECGEPLRMPGRTAAHRPVGGRQLEWELVPTPGLPAAWLRQVWQYVEQRLLRSDPGAHASLRPPARPQDVVSAGAPGPPFHPQLTALLLLHDGADAPGGHRIFPGGYRPYSCAEVRAAHGRMKAAARSAEPEESLWGRAVTSVGGPAAPAPAPSAVPADTRPANASWVPFAVSRTGDELLLCQERGERYGAVLAWDPAANDYRTGWPDLAALCEGVAAL
ncbi:hypothetical protein [Streptomyces sp. NPDC001348]